MMEPFTGDGVMLITENKGQIRNSFDIQDVDIEENKIKKFWKNIENFRVWRWSKKYPSRKSKYIPKLDGQAWYLKLRDNGGKSKYCSGYERYPNKFRQLIKELNSLFGSNIKF